MRASLGWSSFSAVLLLVVDFRFFPRHLSIHLRAHTVRSGMHGSYAATEGAHPQTFTGRRFSRCSELHSVRGTEHAVQNIHVPYVCRNIE